MAMNARIHGPKPQGGLKGGCRFSRLPLLHQQEPQALPGVGIAGIQLESRAIFGGGPGKKTLLLEDQTQVVAGFRIIRLEPKRGPESKRRRVELPEAHPGVALIVMKLRRFGTERDGALNEIHRVLLAAGLQGDDTQQVQCVGMVWILRQNSAIKGLRLPQPPGLVVLNPDLKRLWNRHVIREWGIPC